MYINDVDEDDRVLVLDDVLSTGGTLSALLTALEDIGATVVDTVVVIKKVDGENKLDALEHDPKTLIHVEMRGDNLVIVDEAGNG
jgi:adenine phosphoribosyltransferase